MSAIHLLLFDHHEDDAGAQPDLCDGARVAYSEGLMEPGKKKRKEPRPQGYATQPGTGPEGETCGSCKYHEVIRYSKNYHKCALTRGTWTHGRASDILVRTPACSKWEGKE